MQFSSRQTVFTVLFYTSVSFCLLCPSICFWVCLSLLLCPSISLSLTLSVYLFLSFLFTCFWVCLSVYRVRLYLSGYVCLFLCPSIFVCLSVYVLSVLLCTWRTYKPQHKTQRPQNSRRTTGPTQVFLALWIKLGEDSGQQADEQRHNHSKRAQELPYGWNFA